MKEVRVCEAMKSPVGTSSDGTVLHQQDGGTKSRQVPIWEKSNLTLEEAAAYSGIGTLPRAFKHMGSWRCFPCRGYPIRTVI